MLLKLRPPGKPRPAKLHFCAWTSNYSLGVDAGKWVVQGLVGGSCFLTTAVGHDAAAHHEAHQQQHNKGSAAGVPAQGRRAP